MPGLHIRCAANDDLLTKMNPIQYEDIPCDIRQEIEHWYDEHWLADWYLEYDGLYQIPWTWSDANHPGLTLFLYRNSDQAYESYHFQYLPQAGWKHVRSI